MNSLLLKSSFKLSLFPTLSASFPRFLHQPGKQLCDYIISACTSSAFNFTQLVFNLFIIMKAFLICLMSTYFDFEHGDYRDIVMSGHYLKD